MDGVDALLPVLVAEVLDDDARRLLAGLARERRVCLVPLVDPPVDASLHVLEVTTPDSDDPLLLLAEPAGAPTERGFPLRLHPYDEPPASRSREDRFRVDVPAKPDDEPLPSVRTTNARPATLSLRHTADLSGDLEVAADESDAEALIGRDISNGKLVIESLVGVGGMGAVYRARHKQLGRQVAVKVLHPRYRSDLAFCARFHAEALAVSQLDHPNLVRIYDYGQEPDGLLYIAMELLEGVELETVLSREGTLPLRRIVDIGMQVCAGLAHAHSRGLVHRDVKPSNIILVRGDDDDDGHSVEMVKICDFGIARASALGEDPSVEPTRRRDVIGTPAYMSPEQCEGGDIDGRSDIYALGVILFELTTGQLPFNASQGSEIVRMHLEAEPPRPASIRTVDKRLEELILRTLRKSPEQRPQRMRDLRADLKALLRPPSLDLPGTHAGSSGRGEQRFTSSMQISAQQAAVNLPAIAAALAREPISTLRERLTSPERFATEARVLAAAMRLLLQQGEHAALAQVIALFNKLSRDNSEAASEPIAEIARSVVRSIADPKLLTPVAEKALAEHEGGESAQAVLAGLGVAAAHALYATRVRAKPTPPVRGRFVAAIRSIGPAAWPLLAAALQRNAPGSAATHDPRLGEDLLRSLPKLADESAGGVVASYLRWGEPAVRRAAIAPLAALWGDRARALLLGVVMKDPDEGARINAIKALKDIRAVDEVLAKKLADMLAAAGDGDDALRITIAEALGETLGDSRAIAAAALRRALAPPSDKGGLFARGARTKTRPFSPPTLLALCAAFVRVGGADAKATVVEIAEPLGHPLKGQLLWLVSGDATT